MAENIDTLFPEGEQPPDPDEELNELEDDLDAPSPEDLVVAEEPPPPLARSCVFDFAAKRFIRARGGPIEVRGIPALRTWIEKCLHTERGSSAIHSEDYGLLDATGGIGEGFDSPALADLEERVTDALLFHPRIRAVSDWEQDYDPDDDFVSISFTVSLDDETAVPIEGLVIGSV